MSLLLSFQQCVKHTEKMDNLEVNIFSTAKYLNYY